MQSLPIPKLDQTLQRFMGGISPLLSPQQRDATAAAAQAFQNQGGPILQQRLQAYAQTQENQGLSWLTELKLAEYLQDTRPHAITNNASLQINYQTAHTGIKRAVSLIYRLAWLHLDYINDNIEPPIDPRGQPISMYNWRLLTGAIREPSADKAVQDSYYYAPKQAANRSMSLFWQGHHFTLPLTDNTGKLISAAQIEAILELIINADYEKPVIDFTEVSALGSVKVASYLNQLCQQPHNKQAYQAVKDSLFCLSLYRSGADDVTQIQQQTFMPGHAWQLKPNTYQMDLDSDFLAIHFEHSEIDGAALQHMFNYAFGLVDAAPEALKSHINFDDDSHSSEKSVSEAQRLDWQCDDESLLLQIQQDIEDIRQRAQQIKVQRSLADYSGLQGKVSHDALMQFALLYAQLKTFGQVRNTYEAVDTSHFMAGRTEGLRPNSEQAIALVQELLDDDNKDSNNAKPTTDMDLLQQALDAHKQRVIACKTGQAFDRHLSGLKYMMTDADANDSSMAEFFNSPGYKTLTGGDFLSTSSMGTQSPVRRILFAPVMAGGFGVNYSLDDSHYEFVLFADQDSSPYLEQMCDACVEAIAKLVALTQQA
ncbi:choline/carnitine O-acyltransferase [Psychrobacter sp. FDAARGOS_221]|uniref:choline/carnitine O-acyltransferase n=1 Tax=Psychrobacter sp. FDAARGOS_221 TaxID=1975705 RepID=UPI000BB567E2|nr:choline/carnitine O-acyltransferase [Psychrobacter sp. FDAARGOS_221]PNK61610.1 choline/carnitine O-acyltransferase [Psychrobacter sp. FDAARGOS_221]